MARNGQILKKVTPDLSEKSAREKDDLFRDIVKELGKRDEKWVVALTSE